MRYLVWVWLVLSVTAFCLMGWDKRQARRGGERVPEREFFLLAILGGCPGAIAGMYYFRHKTLHRSFKWGLPAILAAQIALGLLAVTCMGGQG